MLTHYLPTMNLSVDNALSVQQQIHQLITMMNNINDYLNNLDSELDDRITVLISRQLEDFKVLIDNEITKAKKECNEYTNLKADEIYRELSKINAQIDILKTDIISLDDKTDDLKVYIDREVNTLENKMNQLLKESVGAISPMTGTVKSVSDAIYDANQQSLKTASYTIQQMLELIYSDTEIINRMGETIPLITTVEQFLSDSLSNSPKTYFGNNLVYLQQGSTTIDSLTTSSKGYLANCYKWAEDVNTGKRSRVLFTEIISDITGLEDEVFQGTWLFFNSVSCINKTFFKDENTRNDYLMKARDMGLLNMDNTIKETGEYPL